MHLLPDGLPLQAPGVCFLCERSPESDNAGNRDEPVVDTLIEFRADVYTHLTGRKYVCTPCVRNLAKVWLGEPEAEEEII